ncbi:hypothetical protein ACH6CV_14300 [Bacillota bacterium Meth-B3]
MTLCEEFVMDDEMTAEETAVLATATEHITRAKKIVDDAIDPEGMRDVSRDVTAQADAMHAYARGMLAAMGMMGGAYGLDDGLRLAEGIAYGDKEYDRARKKLDELREKYSV